MHFLHVYYSECYSVCYMCVTVYVMCVLRMCYSVFYICVKWILQCVLQFVCMCVLECVAVCYSVLLCVRVCYSLSHTSSYLTHSGLDPKYTLYELLWGFGYSEFQMVKLGSSFRTETTAWDYKIDNKTYTTPIFNPILVWPKIYTVWIVVRIWMVSFSNGQVGMKV